MRQRRAAKGSYAIRFIRVLFISHKLCSFFVCELFLSRNFLWHLVHYTAISSVSNMQTFCTETFVSSELAKTAHRSTLNSASPTWADSAGVVKRGFSSPHPCQKAPLAFIPRLNTSQLPSPWSALSGWRLFPQPQNRRNWKTVADTPLQPLAINYGVVTAAKNDSNCRIIPTSKLEKRKFFIFRTKRLFPFRRRNGENTPPKSWGMRQVQDISTG